MQGIPGLCFALASHDRARFVRADQDNRLHTVDWADTISLCGPMANSIGPPDQGDAGEVLFARRLAQRINEDFAVDKFTHLVLVAPPQLLVALTATLDAATRAGLFGTLAKDLIAVPDLELWPHLLPWLQPSAAVRSWPVASREW